MPAQKITANLVVLNLVVKMHNVCSRNYYKVGFNFSLEIIRLKLAKFRSNTPIHMTPDGDAQEMPVDVHAMWTTPQTSGRASSSPSTPLSAVYFPTRGWASPGGSVMSAPTARYPQGPQRLPPRTIPFKQAMCYLC
jgi:hypothetical protein